MSKHKHIYDFHTGLCKCGQHVSEQLFVIEDVKKERSELIRLIEGSRVANRDNDDYDLGWDSGYNQALEDIKELIRSRG